MSYEVLGKIFLTIIIFIGIIIIWIIGMFIFVILEEQVDKIPQWIKTTIGLTILSLVIGFISMAIYSSL